MQPRQFDESAFIRPLVSLREIAIGDRVAFSIYDATFGETVFHCIVCAYDETSGEARLSEVGKSKAFSYRVPREYLC